MVCGVSERGGWRFGGRRKRRHHQRGKNKTVNIFECVVAIGPASDGLMWLSTQKSVTQGVEIFLKYIYI